MKSRNASEVSISNKSEITPHSRAESESESIAEFIARVKSKSESSNEIGNKSKSKKKSEPQQEAYFDTESEPDLSESNTSLKSNINDESSSWWKESVTEYAFNLPTVGANLDRLIGTDVVKLNKHKFMMDLRKNVWNDFDEELRKKIMQREVLEIERTKKLILKCKYSSYNCPDKLKPLHSAVLALNLDTEENNLTKPEETRRYEGPVFLINKKTNNIVRLRRMKLKSIRKTNFEYLMRQVYKDIKNAEKLKYNELRAIQENIKHIQQKVHKKKSKRSKYLKVITSMVDKLKTALRSKDPKKEPKESRHELTLLEATTPNSIKGNLTDKASHPGSFKNKNPKKTLKNASKESKSLKLNSNNSKMSMKDSKDFKSTSLITRDTRKLKKSSSRVSFG